MNKEYIIRKNEEISLIVKTGNKKVTKFFIIYYINNDEAKNMYCISVSKKLGKAYVRNKIKRRIKNIIDNNKKIVHNGYDYVIIIKKGILDLTYKEIETELLKLISIGD